jgi:hypothetical protein
MCDYKRNSFVLIYFGIFTQELLFPDPLSDQDLGSIVSNDFLKIVGWVLTLSTTFKIKPINKYCQLWVNPAKLVL